MPYYPPSGGSNFDPTKPGTLGGTTPATDIITESIECIGDARFSDGSSTLSADGSGNFAGGNVTWDASGNFVSIGSFTAGSNSEFAGEAQFDAGINAAALPSSDPHVMGEFWSNLGIATISAG